METKLHEKRIESVRRRLGFNNGLDVSAEGSKGGLSMAWKGNYVVSLRIYSHNHFDVDVLDEGRNLKWRFIGFYGILYANRRDNSWRLLNSLHDSHNGPWLVGGDFNEIMYAYEKVGRAPREEKREELFRGTLAECQLIDLRYSSTWHTWKRGNLSETNIRERLDRGVANANLIYMFPDVKVCHLSYSHSDYCPIIIQLEKSFYPKGRCFRFENWWTLESSYLDEVRKLWDCEIGDIIAKLDWMRLGLGTWAKSLKRRNGLVERDLQYKFGCVC